MFLKDICKTYSILYHPERVIVWCTTSKTIWQKLSLGDLHDYYHPASLYDSRYHVFSVSRSIYIDCWKVVLYTFSSQSMCPNVWLACQRATTLFSLQWILTDDDISHIKRLSMAYCGHIVLSHVISCEVTWRHDISRDVVWRHDNTRCHKMSCKVMWYVMLYNALWWDGKHIEYLCILMILDRVVFLNGGHCRGFCYVVCRCFQLPRSITSISFNLASRIGPEYI